MSSDAVVNVDDVVAARSKGDRLTESADLDELSESINITEQETVEYVEDDDEFSAEQATRSRRRLRNLLIFFIIILLVLIAIIGLFIWRNSTPRVSSSRTPMFCKLRRPAQTPRSSRQSMLRASPISSPTSA